jgi:hypothetical protein
MPKDPSKQELGKEILSFELDVPNVDVDTKWLIYFSSDLSKMIVLVVVNWVSLQHDISRATIFDLKDHTKKIEITSNTFEFNSLSVSVRAYNLVSPNLMYNIKIMTSSKDLLDEGI